MKTVLLLAPAFLDLYKDVIAELVKQGYKVEYIQDKSFKIDPYLIRIKQSSRFKGLFYNLFLCFYWLKNIFRKWGKWENIDILFTINGMSFHPILLFFLKRKNKNLKAYLYLWDRTYENYRFERHFKYFDRVATFDRIDAEIYKIGFMPNYWIPYKDQKDECYEVFAFGAYRKDRYELFSKINGFYTPNTCKNYIFIYVRQQKIDFVWKLKQLIKSILRRNNDSLESFVYDKTLLSHNSLSPKEFREKVYSSKCIIDTNNDFQEGMTPRFMWALGSGKKIITTNANVKKYPFYDESRILIADDSLDKEKFQVFMNTPIRHISDSLISVYRIDNWLKFIIGDNK